jgi:hypothetical protein
MTLLAEAPALLGATVPRIFTPPLVTGPPGPCGCGCALTPETSEGFEVVEFADEIEHPFLPWQRFSVIHGLELLPDGRPRFRILVLLVSRQNGKTELPVVLSVWWQFRKKVPLVLGTSTKLAYAKESWQKAVNLVKRTSLLDDLHEPGRRWYRRTNGETESWSLAGARYLIAASNDEGGRSLTIHRGVADELRQHDSYAAWEAFEPACSPVDAQIWALSNAGSAKSPVLNDLQDSAREFIETGEGDPRLGLIEYSAPEDADPEDVDALLQANPRVGYGLDFEVLLAAARRAKRLGGPALSGFLTERMCRRVKLLDPAIEPAGWRDCRDPGTLDEVRARVALVFDVAPSMQHCTLYAAAQLPDGRVRIEPVQAWEGPGCVDQAARDLPAVVAAVKPRVFGWLPSGPGAAVASKLKDRTAAGRRSEWPPRGVTVEEIRAELVAVCMGFAELVVAGKVAHSADPLLDADVGVAEKLPRPGGTWVFSRKGDGDCDAVYAAAGAAHLAQTLPPPAGRTRVLLPTVR